jgi:hypothetical protein
MASMISAICCYYHCHYYHYNHTYRHQLYFYFLSFALAFRVPNCAKNVHNFYFVYNKKTPRCNVSAFDRVIKIEKEIK